MTKNITNITILALLTAALLTVPGRALAEGNDTKPPTASDQNTPDKPKIRVTPFHGKLGAVDAKAMTFTVGKMIIHVTADTKITKSGQPATLADGVAGEPVGGAYQKGDDGKLTATTVHFGARTENKPQEPATGAGQK